MLGVSTIGGAGFGGFYRFGFIGGGVTMHWNILQALAIEYSRTFMLIYRPETHIKRQAALHDCLPRLLGDRDK
jgi:hypothetical protein